MKKVLVILSRVPYPLEKGDKLRAFHQIKVLAEKYEVSLFALDDPSARSGPEAVKVLQQYCSTIEVVKLNTTTIYFNILKAFIKGLPLQVGYFYSSKAVKKLAKLVRSHAPDHIYCQLIRTAEYVKDVKDVPLTLDYMDALSKGIERRIPKAGFFMKAILQLECKRLKKYECEVFDRFRVKTIISGQDRRHIEHPESKAILIVPNGVDTEFYAPGEKAEKQYDILFSGNMAYPPNIETAVYLARKVLPLVQSQRPGTTLAIAGVDPAPQVRALAATHITVTGRIDDMRSCYRASRVFAAPMHISIGMQNKILEAMAMELPCICSVPANNAIGAVSGEHVLLGENAAEYAHHILKFLEDPEFAGKLAKNGRDFVAHKYSWATASDELVRIFA